MKTKSKGFILAIAAALAISLAACTGPASSPSSSNAPIKSKNTQPVATPAEMDALGIGNPSPAQCEGRDKITVGYDVFSDTQDYVVSMNKSLKDVAAEIGGCVEFVMLVDNLDPATALANIKTFIQRKVDIVLLFQVVASAQPGIMSLLNEAGIPVITHAVGAEGSYFMTSSDEAAAEASANGLIDAMKTKYPGETPYLILGDEPTSGEQSEKRVNHQAEIIRAAFPAMTDSDVVLLGATGLPDDAFTRTNNILAKVPTDRPVLIAGINDDVVGAMFRALDQGGKSAKVLAAGMGALFPSGVQNVCDHVQFVGTVDFEPDGLGKWLVPALLAVTNGVRLPDVTDTPISLLTPEAVPTRFPGFKCR